MLKAIGMLTSANVELDVLFLAEEVGFEPT